MDTLTQAARLLRHSANTVALTGAGISTPSGIPDFRSTESGLWTHRDPMRVASFAGFRQQPIDFYEWVLPLARQTLCAQPNPAHFALAQLETAGRLQAVITQNVDMLHTRAGSQTVYELHGSLQRAMCMHCFREYPTEEFIEGYLERGELPICVACGGVLKPNVILFGEALPAVAMTNARLATERCAVMVIIGSSLLVAPACNLPMLAMHHGAKLIIINQDSTPLDSRAEVIIRSDVAEALPRLAQMILEP